MGLFDSVLSEFSTAELTVEQIQDHGINAAPKKLNNILLCELSACRGSLQHTERHLAHVWDHRKLNYILQYARQEVKSLTLHNIVELAVVCDTS